MGIMGKQIMAKNLKNMIYTLKIKSKMTIIINTLKTMANYYMINQLTKKKNPIIKMEIMIKMINKTWEKIIRITVKIKVITNKSKNNLNMAKEVIDCLIKRIEDKPMLGKIILHKLKVNYDTGRVLINNL